MKNLYLILFLAAFVVISSCSDEEKKPNNDNGDPDTTKIDTNKPVNVPKMVKIDAPRYNQMFTLGDEIEISAALIKDEDQIDSLVLIVDDKPVYTANQLPFKYKWTCDVDRPGKVKFVVKSYYEGKEEINTSYFQLKSDLAPTKYTYEIINKYPHDPKAYSQGLFYEDGILYEGTGQYGESTIRKVEIETGEVKTSFNMPNSIFGEGITILGNRIIQLSWRAGKGYVYDKKSYEIIQEFEYTSEGWGITSDGEKLFMTDGTNKVRILDKDNFVEKDYLEVYTDMGPVSNLNELEYIDGKIYSNVYLTDYIMIIDPETGKVEGQIDLTGLLSHTKVTSKVDVLNGIAYDAEGDRLFVTGKWWPTLFQIKLKKK